MLADGGESPGHSGTLDRNLHLPGEWLSSLIAFIGNALPGWRDDPERPTQTAETALTAQLCARLNSVTRHAAGWDFLQFKREDPDESKANRSIDLVVAPSGARLWIAGREHSIYRTLLPIECKRLPTPPDTTRDEREYLFSRTSSTGGVQRFKAGHHGASHGRAAMIGYIQERSIPHWHARLDAWIEALASGTDSDWTAADKLALIKHDPLSRSASLRSSHQRHAGLEAIIIDHLWIEM